VLRQRALPQVDFTDPASVLSSLNTRFQMSAHNGLFFTMWYGVYRVGARTLTCASAGHHPAYLVGPDKTTAQPLGAPALIVGILPGSDYETQQTVVPPGSSLYLFSDGVFEIMTKDQQRWTLPDFLPLLLEARTPGISEPARIYRRVTDAAAPGPLDDDFSLMTVAFP
jgi:serine phosphatase RsbU (regulator of sigma subunit)